MEGMSHWIFLRPMPHSSIVARKDFFYRWGRIPIVFPCSSVARNKNISFSVMVECWLYFSQVSSMTVVSNVTRNEYIFVIVECRVSIELLPIRYNCYTIAIFFLDVGWLKIDNFHVLYATVLSIDVFAWSDMLTRGYTF